MVQRRSIVSLSNYVGTGLRWHWLRWHWLLFKTSSSEQLDDFMHSNGLKLVYTLCDVDIDERLRWGEVSLRVSQACSVVVRAPQCHTLLYHSPNPSVSQSGAGPNLIVNVT